MVRYVWIGTMLAILCIVLYIPSASPPERFTEVLRAEHDITRRHLGPGGGRPHPQADARHPAGLATSERAAGAHGSRRTAAGCRRGHGGADDPDEHAPVRQPLLPVDRLSVRARHLPAERHHRVAAATGDLPAGGGCRRLRASTGASEGVRRPQRGDVRRQPDRAIMLGGMVAVSAFLPMRLHPMFFTLSLLAMLFALSRAIANYHVIRSRPSRVSAGSLAELEVTDGSERLGSNCRRRPQIGFVVSVPAD
jgi:hypothetical protein